MVDPSSRAPTLLQTRRERIVEHLCRYVAEDVLSLEDFEQRVDAAHRARTRDELEAVLDGLPGPATAPPVATAGERPAGALAERGASQIIAAIMGGASRAGRWVPAERTTVFALMGGAELDFREARLPAGVTEVVAVAIWGGVEIIVPPDLNVEIGGTAIMGGFEQTEDAHFEPDLLPAEEPRTLRITGLALMGGVEIKVRYPGESERDARRRRKEDRRRLRERRDRLHGG